MAHYSEGRDSASPADQPMLDALMALSRAVVGMTTRSLNQVGADVTLTQYRSLVVLASRGPQRTTELAAELGIQPSTATRLCDRLLARGFVRRQPGETDRRVVLVVLTDAGRSLVGQAMSGRRELLTGLLRRVRVTDPQAFAEAATALAVAAGELAESQWRQRWQASTSVEAFVRAA
jgi:DNA-binding MarR family transcriptional regulator